jgi:hypothetical protein
MNTENMQFGWKNSNSFYQLKKLKNLSVNMKISRRKLKPYTIIVQKRNYKKIEIMLALRKKWNE